ncbi:MAG TPA: hypothetical protein VK905_05045 [Bacillota bacterium]|nr:hypothetical protein [Bacillota bacterium]
MKKWLVFAALLVALCVTLISGGCTARSPQLELTMITELNLDGSGQRVFRVMVSQDVLNLAQAKLDDKEASVLDTLDMLKPEPLQVHQTFLIPDVDGRGKYVDFVLPFASVEELKEKLSLMAGIDVRLSLDPLDSEGTVTPFETRMRLQEANHMTEYFGWVTDALQMYFRELDYQEVSLRDLPVYYEIRVPGKLERSQVGQVQVLFSRQESGWWTRAYRTMLDAFSRQASRIARVDGVSYSTRGVDLYDVSIIASDFSTGVLYTEFFSRVAVERVLIRTHVLPAPWYRQLLGSHPAAYSREMIVEFPENYRSYIEGNRASFTDFFARYISDGIRGDWIESGNRLAYRMEFFAADEVGMRELSYRIVDQNRLRVSEVRNSTWRSLTAVFSALNPANWGQSARTLLTDLFSRRIEYEEALKPVAWLESATIIKDVVYEMHFPYRLEGVGGNLATAVVAQGQNSFTYSWPAGDPDAIRHVLFYARAWDVPAMAGGAIGLMLFPLLFFLLIRLIIRLLKNIVFLGFLATLGRIALNCLRYIWSLLVRIASRVKNR